MHIMTLVHLVLDFYILLHRVSTFVHTVDKIMKVASVKLLALLLIIDTQ
jgi:hypothetical protein